MSAKHAFVIEEIANPSSDFFIIPALEIQNYSIQRIGFNEPIAEEQLTDAIIVFVRYIPSHWLRRIEKARHKINTLVFFMDDDVLDPEAALSMPWRYQLKLRRLASSRKKWLRKQQAQLWVSTPYLMQKYVSWRPKLVLPRPLSQPVPLCKLFYHGSASHSDDIRWLKPVVEQVLQANTDLCFEIIGGQPVYQLYKTLPRTTIVHPMKWQQYQTFTSLQRYDIGLNPLVANRFNQARSYTKFFDITRFNAVGIYAPNSACADVIEHNKEGLIVAMNPTAWIEAILRLASDLELRQYLLTNAQLRLQQLAEQATDNNGLLLSTLS